MIAAVLPQIAPLDAPAPDYVVGRAEGGEDIALRLRLVHVLATRRPDNPLDDLPDDKPDLKDFLSSRVTSEFGVRVARFEANTYHPAFEAMLRDLGIDLILVEKPSGIESRALANCGLVEKPERIAWTMPVKSPEEYLSGLGSKDRNRIRQKLRPSADVEVEVTPLSAENFAAWYEIYEADVVGKERGRRAISADWFDKRGKTDQYRAVFYYDKDSHKLLGGAIISLNGAELSLTISYAAYRAEHRHMNLGTRTFVECLTLAHTNGYKILSHGSDRNLYGFYLSPGLAEFKAGLGFVPSPARNGNLELVKVLNPAAFNNECLFFEETQAATGDPRSGSMRARHLTATPRPIVAPAACDVLSTAFPAAHRAQLSNELDILSGVLALEPEQGLRAARLLRSIAIEHGFLHQGSSDEGDQEAERHPQRQARAEIFSVLYYLQSKAPAALAIVTEHARSSGLLLGSADEVCQAEVACRFAEPDARARLASYIGRQQLGIYMDFLVPKLLIACQCPIEALSEAPESRESRDRTLLHVFEYVDAHAGRDKLAAFIGKLIGCFDPHLSPTEVMRVSPAEQARELKHLTLDDISYERHFADENISAARVLLEALFQEHLRVPYSFGLRSLLDHDHGETDTVGGKVIAQLNDLLDSLSINGARTSRDFNSDRRGKEYRQRVRALTALMLTAEERALRISDRHEEQFVRLLESSDLEATSSVQIAARLLCVGVDPACVNLAGQSVRKSITEVYRRASPEQAAALQRVGYKHNGIASSFRALFSDQGEEDFADKHVEQPPLRVLPLDSAELENTLDRTVSVLVDAQERDLFVAIACRHLEIPHIAIKSWRSVDGEAAYLIYSSVSRPGHSLDGFNERMIEAAREYAQRSGDPHPLCAMHYHPTASGSMSRSDLVLTLSLLSRRGTPFRTDTEVLACFQALASASTKPGAEATLAMVRVTDYPTNFYSRLYRDSLQRQAGLAFERWNLSEAQLSSIGATYLDFCNALAGSAAGRSADFEAHLSNAYGNAACLRIADKALDSLLLRRAQVDPQSAMSFIERSLGAAWARSHPTVLAEVRAGVMARDDFEAYRLQDLALQSPWQEAFAGSVVGRELELVAGRRRNELITPQEISSFVSWAMQRHPSPAVDATAVRIFELACAANLDVRKQACVWMSGLLRRYPVEPPHLITHLSSVVDLIDPEAVAEIRELTIANREILRSHPWAAYGFDEKVVLAVHAFAADPNLSSLQIDQLCQFLFSGRGNSSNVFWISYLVRSAPRGDFSHLSRFARFWNSLKMEAQDNFIGERVTEVLADVRLGMSRDCEGAHYQNLQRLVATKRAAGEEVPAGLAARVERLDTYRQLFRLYGASTVASERHATLARLDELLLKDRPPHLDPVAEQQALIDYQHAAFCDRLVGAGLGRDEIARFLSKFGEPLQNSGVLDRLVQYSSFAEPAGMKLLVTLVRHINREGKSRIVQVPRPDQADVTSTHLDTEPTFYQLRWDLFGRGAEVGDLDKLMLTWCQLYTFIPVDGSPDMHLSVTHDIARWVRHGEEPCRSCQVISVRTGNMLPTNWNYQFGPNGSTDGRPIARMLLPQLKLAELREAGKLVGRCVLEVTATPSGELALLVERYYFAKGVSAESQMCSAVYHYADMLGIRAENIYQADKLVGQQGVPQYPAPLPERYRIYRDFFRPG